MGKNYDPAEDWTLRVYDPWERDEARAAPSRIRLRLPGWLMIGAALGGSFLLGEQAGLHGAMPTAAEAPEAASTTVLASARANRAIVPDGE